MPCQHQPQSTPESRRSAAVRPSDGEVILADWASRGFGTLAEERLAIVALTLVVAGIQVFFTAFLISLLGLRRVR
jgi:hypothetical protein